MAKEQDKYGQHELLRDVDVWKRFAQIPDDFPLAPKQAAVLITFSERTLQDWRKSGAGPAYFQGGLRVEPDGKEAPKGTNQHVRYFKSDIAAWWEKNKVSDAMMAAARKGQTLVESLRHLTQEAAFYVDGLGQVEGLVEDGTVDDLLAADESRIQWLLVSDAASRAWTDLDKHRELASKVKAALSGALKGVDTGLEKTEMSSVTREAPSKKRRIDAS